MVCKNGTRNWGYDGQVSELPDNQRMLQSFSVQCFDMLVPLGEVHVTHKTKAPFDWWGIPDQLRYGGLACQGAVVFDRAVHPPYVNRKVSTLIRDSMSVDTRQHSEQLAFDGLNWSA